MSDTATPSTPVTPTTSNQAPTTQPSVVPSDDIVAWAKEALGDNFKPAVISSTPPPASTPEVPPTANEKQPEETNLDYIHRMAHIQKREKALAQKQLAMKEVQDKADQWAQLAEVAKTNPMAVLEAFGLTHAQITDYILDSSDPAKQQFNALKQEIDAIKKQKEDEATSAAQARDRDAEAGYLGDIQQMVHADVSKYEFIATEGAYETVMNTVKAYYEETKEQMTPENLRVATLNAMEAVERHLENIATQKYLSLNKVKSRFQPATPAPQPQQPSTQVPPVTLSSFQQSSTTNQNPAHRTEQERLEAALKFLQ
jgi:hypothetical protein